MQSKSGLFTLGEGSFGKVFGKVSCISRAALPETFEAFVGLRRRYTCETLRMGEDQCMLRCISSFEDHTRHAGEQVYS